jgi:hypothetical protein
MAPSVGIRGANQFHGSLFEYLQNDALDANPYGFNGKAPKRFNTFGGSLGGPVTIPHLYHGHDKTFFFADYEGNRRTTAIARQLLVPTAAERNGDLRGLGVNAQIPTSSINPTAKALLACYPLPNVTGQSTTTTRTSSPRLRALMAPISALIKHSMTDSLRTHASVARTSLPTMPMRFYRMMWTASTIEACSSRTRTR